MIFLDTSAIYALADRKDLRHEEARGLFAALLEGGEGILTHNYVLVEAMSLINGRLGLGPALKLAGDARAFEVEWVDPSTHQEALRRWAQRGRRRASFVDEVSFLVMRGRGVVTAFAFDADFEAQGFRSFSLP